MFRHKQDRTKTDFTFTKSSMVELKALRSCQVTLPLAPLAPLQLPATVALVTAYPLQRCAWTCVVIAVKDVAVTYFVGTLSFRRYQIKFKFANAACFEPNKYKSLLS